MNVETTPKRIDPDQFRQVMGRFATGVTVITARAHGETRGMTANAFMSGSLDPPLCVVSVAKRAHMHPLLSSAGRFGVNFLALGQERIAWHFAGRPEAGLDVAIDFVDDVPVLADAAARILSVTAATHDCGDHTLFVGHIGSMSSNSRPPLLYHASRFGAFVAFEEEEAALPELW
jgi:flavin reductase (DIM6/NTAB) family NADH-FMN oxidoreductase RutF